MTNDIEHEVARRVAKVGARYIMNPGLREALSAIEETRRKRRQNGKAFCSLVTGYSGVGKTRLFETYLGRQPEPTGDFRPVVMLTVPPTHNDATFMEAILGALGEPVLGGQRPPVLGERLGRALERRHVELLLLEEASHIVDKKAADARIPYRVTDAIKTYLLDGAYPVPIVMNGIPVARNIFEINPQMETRRHRTVELEPYSYKGLEEEDEPYALLVEVLEADAEFEEPFLANNRDAIRRFHYATGGFHARVAKLMCDATELVIRKHARGLSIEILAEAFARISDPGPGWFNPFLVETMPEAEEPDRTRRTRLHKRGRLR